MKASVVSVLAVAASVMAHDGGEHTRKSTVSTVYTTNVYTVTSCAPEVTDCPGRLGQVTTDIISLYTTICPVTATETPVVSTPSAASSSAGVLTTPVVTPKVSTIYQTVEYTITSCAASITNCPVGSKTSSVLTSTVICPGPGCAATTIVPVCPGPMCQAGTTTAPAVVPTTAVVTKATSAGVVPTSAPVCPGPQCVEASSKPVVPVASSKATSAGAVTTPAPVTPATSKAPVAESVSSVCNGALCPVVITTQITTCVPTVIYQTVTLTASNQMCNGVPCVAATGVPTSAALCNGVPCVAATGVPTGAASSALCNGVPCVATSTAVGTPIAPCSGAGCVVASYPAGSSSASTAVPCVGAACAAASTGVATSVVPCSGAGCAVATSAPVCPGGSNCPATTVATKPYSTGSATGVYPGGPMNSTIAFTGAASSNKAVGFLMVVGLFAALL